MTDTGSNFRLDKEKARVIIVGAGVGGLATAILLKRKLNFDNFLIFDKAADIGGTWEANQYPGCGSDVGGHWYSLSTDLNPNWKSHYATQPELQEYWRGLTNKYTLWPHLVLSTSVISAVWDNEKQSYTVTLRDEGSGREWEEVAELVVDATGGLALPAYPSDIKDRDAFAGVQFHSARWRKDVELSGKKVGVIGNGCSAAQLVPNIAEDSSVEVLNFCRTPSWYVSRNNKAYSSWQKWVFANVPFAGRAYRFLVYSTYEFNILLFMPWLKIIREKVQDDLKKRIIRKAPKEYVDKLLPDYPAGCKRLIIDPGYLSCLSRPNVNLTWDAIEAVVPEGVKMKTGEVIPLDVIVWATGFAVLNVGLDVKGREGTLSEFYESKGGPEAYLGTTTPGFPNYFLLMGANSATGHASIIFSEEVQINYFLQLMKPVIEKKAKSFEVRLSASDEYNAKVQRRMVGTVWTQCRSWYQNGDKNVAIFPGPMFVFWWWARVPRWEHYIASGAGRWEAERKRSRFLGAAFTALLLVFSAGLSQPTFREVVLSGLTQAMTAVRSYF